MDDRIDLQSIAETHEKPFLIVSQDSRILAANSAFLRAYQRTLSEIRGKFCYQVTHNLDRPCDEEGEECPLQRVHQTGKPHTCLHIHAHHDRGERIHHVRVKGFPLRLGGEMLFAEIMEEIAVRSEENDLQHAMIGRSKAFLASLEQMKLAARSDAPVLVQGETGTGKELAAYFIHEHSLRCQGPFLNLDCRISTETLAESELFGYQRDAFTDSVNDRKGLFTQADGGTLFLDEIGELPKRLQTKLLRVLETGVFRRVGSDTTVSSNARIICATTRDLWQEVERGNFREDLYYRLAGLTVRLPSIRQRREDIPDLAEYLLRRIRGPRQVNASLAPEAREILEEYDYPGNVRELKNMLQAACDQVQGPTIDKALIKKVMDMRTGTDPGPEKVNTPEPGGAAHPQRVSSLAEVERAHIAILLRQHEGNRAAVAKALGVTERTVYRKLKRYGLS